MFSPFRSLGREPLVRDPLGRDPLGSIEFSSLDMDQSPPPVSRPSGGWPLRYAPFALLGLAAVAFGGITIFQRPNSAESQENTVTLEGIAILERPNSAESQETTVPIEVTNQSLATTSSEPAAVPFPVAPPIAPAKVADSEDTVVSPDTQPKWPIESKTLEQLPKVIQDYCESFLKTPGDLTLSLKLHEMMEEGLYRCKDCLVAMAKENPSAILSLLIEIKVITLDIKQKTLHTETIRKLTDKGIVQTKPNSNTLTMAFVMPIFYPLWHQSTEFQKNGHLINTLAKLGERLDELEIDPDDKTKILSFLKTDNVTILSLIKDNTDLLEAIRNNTNELQKELYIDPALDRADKEKAEMETTLKKL